MAGSSAWACLEKLLELLACPYDQKSHYYDRGEILKLVGQLYGASGTIWVCLWLLDRDGKVEEYRLDQAVRIEEEEYKEFHTCENGVGYTFVRYEKQLNDDNRDNLLKALSIGMDKAKLGNVLPELRKFLDKIDEDFIWIKSSRSGDREIIGVIQVIGGASNNLDIERLQALALASKGLAGQIERSREFREWRTLDGLGRCLLEAGSVRNALNLAAQRVAEACWAESCIITYTRQTDISDPINGTFCRSGCAVDSQKDFIADVERKGEIIRRSNICPSSSGDHKAWMGIPVKANVWNGRHANGEEVICVIELAGKNSKDFFYSVFSEQDCKLAYAAAGILKEVLPKLERDEANAAIFRSLREIDEHFQDANGRFDVDENVAFATGKIIDTVLKIARCVNFVAISKNDRLINDSGNLPCEKIEPILSQILTKSEDDCIYHLADFSIFVTSIGSVLQTGTRILMGVTRNTVVNFRRDILHYMCREFGGVVGDRLRYQRMTHDLIEVRHALRSGLTGLSGNLDAVMRVYSIYSGRSKEEAYEAIIGSDIFRRNLQLASMFAKKTTIFLDQSRIFIKNIVNENLKIVYFDIRKVLNEIINCLEPQAEDRNCNIILRSKLQSDQVFGFADQDLIYIMLFNVIENAVKYSYRDNKIFVNISAVGDDWVVSVVNYGAHIPKEKQRLIFEMFHRDLGPLPADARRPGTGLGLAVASKILRAHNSEYEITVNSDEESNLTIFRVPISRKIKGGVK